MTPRHAVALMFPRSTPEEQGPNAGTIEQAGKRFRTRLSVDLFRGLELWVAEVALLDRFGIETPFDQLTERDQARCLQIARHLVRDIGADEAVSFARPAAMVAARPLTPDERTIALTARAMAEVTA